MIRKQNPHNWSKRDDETVRKITELQAAKSDYLKVQGTENNCTKEAHEQAGHTVVWDTISSLFICQTCGGWVYRK